MTSSLPTFLHNPQCSKSRGARELLDERGVEYTLVEYLKAPLTKAELERIVDLIDDPPSALVRTKDPKFKELGLSASDYLTKAAVVSLLSEYPHLMERPVVIVGEKAAIGRPLENIISILS